MAQKVKLELPKEVAKALEESALLLDKDRAELIAEALASYVKQKYGVEEFENMSVADLIRALRAISMITGMVMEVNRAVGALMPPVQQVQQAPQIQEDALAQVRAALEQLTQSVEELKVRQELISKEEGGRRTAPPPPSVPPELEDVYGLAMTYIKNSMKELLLSVIKPKQPAQAAKKQA
ncbi:MAG: hypothetical protein RXR01_02485 [Thermoproteus sp.]